MLFHKGPVVHLTLENGSNMFFEMTGTTYPVMQLHIPEYWNPELHCHKNLNSGKITFIAGYEIQANVRWYVAFGYTKDSAI